MSNEAWRELCALAQSRPGVSVDDLKTTLFLLRAPRSLRGITFVCSRLDKAFSARPGKREELLAVIEEGSTVLNTLRRLGRLDGECARFGRESLNDGALPYRPETSYSGICDVVVLDAWERNPGYRDIALWFCINVVKFQADRWEQRQYFRYLFEEGHVPLREAKGLGTGRQQARGSQVYAASRHIRELALPAQAARLSIWTDHVPRVEKTASIQFAAMLRVVADRAKRRRAPIEPDQSDALKPIADTAMALFLEVTWGVAQTRPDSDARIRGLARTRTRRRYGRFTGHQAPSNYTGVQSGVATHFQPVGNPNPDAIDDEDPDDPPLDREFSLYLADSDNPIKAMYGARSQQYHLESNNAFLPWSDWRLNQSGLGFLVRFLRDRAQADGLSNRACMVIALSLLTGRSLKEVAKAKLKDGWAGLHRKQDLCVYRGEGLIIIRAATPRLKKAVTPQTCTAAQGRLLRLRIPKLLRALFDECPAEHSASNKQVVRHAKKLLAKCPQHFRITAKGVESTVKLHLLEVSGGDLGLVKLITDGHEANCANLIHYAAYERTEAERLWASAVEALGLATEPSAPAETRKSVGCPQHFLAVGLACEVCEVKSKLRQRVLEAKDWYAILNNLSVYLYMWLGCALAGRSVTQPVPFVMTDDGLCLVADKARVDESTHRLLPIGSALLKQLSVYRSLVTAMGLTYPEVAEVASSEGRLRLVLMKNGKAVRFRPKNLDDHPELDRLPGNFGRKFVRSWATDLPGRIRDAGLGHWTSGRHPLAWTSSLSVPGFRADWLRMQAQLESELGFEVVEIPGLTPARGIPATAPASVRPPVTAAKVGIDPRVSVDCDAVLKAADPKLYRRAFECEKSEKLPEAGYLLVLSALKAASKEEGVDLKALATTLCEYVRKTTRIPLFAARPPRPLQRSWMLSEDGFRDLAFAMREVLPLIHGDLAELPELLNEDDKAVRPSHESLVELGRLLVMAVWFCGVANWPALHRLLKFLASDQPLLATGALRLIELKVPCARSRETMRRTVVLSDLAATYFTVERARIRTVLGAAAALPARSERNRYERGLRAYWQCLGVPPGLTLARFIGASQQNVLVNSSPMLAGYAAGQFVTHDLPDKVLRRLVHLAPRALGGQRMAFEQDEEDIVEAEELGRRDLTHVVGHISSPSKAEWLRVYRNMSGKKGASGDLLLAYAAWAVSQIASENLSKRQRKDLSKKLKVIGHGLLGFSEERGGSRCIRGQDVDLLADLSEPFFPARAHHGAWRDFRKFLLDEALGPPDRGGFAVDGQIDDRSRHVSANLLSAQELDRMLALLRSRLSNIGTPANRRFAAEQVVLVEASGSRRAEVEFLRAKDCQGDAIRVQPYEKHSLKTDASMRQFPVGILDLEAKALVVAASKGSSERVVGAQSGRAGTGDNYFHALNQDLKRVTGDPDVTQHHLRHGFASRALLSVLASSVSLDRISHDVSWIKPLLVEQDKLAVLMGGETSGGHGFQAISAMMGHLHPSTTLKHYVHTLGIAHYALMQELSTGFDLCRTFRNRLASARTIDRKAKEARSLHGAHDPASRSPSLARAMRGALEEQAGKHLGASAGLIDVDDTRLEIKVDSSPPGADQAPITWGFEFFEKLEWALSHGDQSHPHYSGARQALEALAAIPTGQRGSTRFRHPLIRAGPDSVPVPNAPKSGQAVRNAEAVLEWCAGLKQQSSDDYFWLLNKWRNATAGRDNEIRLDGKDEIRRFGGLWTTPSILLRSGPRRVSKRRRPAKPARVLRKFGRIFVAREGGGSASTRNATAVRWALSWLCVIEDVDKHF